MVRANIISTNGEKTLMTALRELGIRRLERLRKVLTEFAENRPTFTCKDLRLFLSVSKTTAQKYVNLMIELGACQVLSTDRRVVYRRRYEKRVTFKFPCYCWMSNVPQIIVQIDNELSKKVVIR